MKWVWRYRASRCFTLFSIFEAYVTAQWAPVVNYTSIVSSVVCLGVSVIMLTKGDDS